MQIIPIILFLPIEIVMLSSMGYQGSEKYQYHSFSRFIANFQHLEWSIHVYVGLSLYYHNIITITEQRLQYRFSNYPIFNFKDTIL